MASRQVYRGEASFDRVGIQLDEAVWQAIGEPGPVFERVVDRLGHLALGAEPGEVLREIVAQVVEQRLQNQLPAFEPPFGRLAPERCLDLVDRIRHPRPTWRKWP